MNLILSIPFEFRLALLVVIGACLGSLVNFLVVRLEYMPRSVSPWFALESNSLANAPVRRWTDRLPIFGWMGMRRETRERRPGFWIRPLMIEVICAVGLATLYMWEVGSKESQLLPAVLQFNLALPANTEKFRVAIVAMHCVFLSHACLSVLMIVASLIDLDEGLIPDEITVPGTLLGLLLAAILPTMLLPVMVSVSGAGMAMPSLDFLTFSAPREWPWPAELLGTPNLGSLAVGLGCVWAWCFALLPRSWRSRHGLGRAMAIFWTRLVRDRLTYWVLAIGVVTSIGTALVWHHGGVHWRALLSAWVGLAAGGGLIWAVRIIGTRLLGREAMGFGDVTLLAMIGAYLGWQPCLVIFLLAPLAGAVVGAIQWLLNRQSEIRYGPFLCLATWVTMLRWPVVWEGISETFLVPWLVPAALMACFLLMVPLLWMVRFVGDRLRARHGSR